MPKDAAARLVEDEPPQPLVTCDEARLLPKRIARRLGDASDDDVADLALGMAADDVNCSGAPHRAQVATMTAGCPKLPTIGSIPRPGASVVVMNPSTRRGAPSARLRVT